MDFITSVVHLALRDQNALNSAQTKHPNWPAPNYVDPQTRVPLLIGVSCASAFVMFVLLVIRIYIRYTMSKRGLGVDDALMVLAAVFSAGLVGIVCVCATHGTGYHNWDIRPEWFPTWGKATFAQNLAFVPAATLTKISILHTYLYLFPSQSNRIFCFTMMAFLWTWGVIQIIVTFTQCSPISSYWDIRMQKKCIQINAYLYTSGTINSFTDIVVYLWPSRTLFALQLPLLRRLGLLAVFSTGLIAVLASILRMVSISKASRDSDSTYAGTFIALWKVLEATFGVKCGCLPAVKPLFSRFLSREEETNDRSKSIKHSSNNFNRLEDGVSFSHVSSHKDVALEGMDPPPTSAIGVTSTTTIVKEYRKPEMSDSDSGSLTDEKRRY